MKHFIEGKFFTTRFWLALLNSVTLICVSLVSYYNMVKLLETVKRDTDTNSKLAALEEILSKVTDAETGRRGYIITGEDRFLEPYNRSTAIIDSQIKQLEVLIAKDPDLQPHFNRLKSLISQRLKLLNQSIDLQKKKGFDTVIQRRLTSREKPLHDEIRLLITEMENEERQILKQNNKLFAAQAKNTGVILIVCFSVSLAIFVLVYSLLERQISERQQAEAKYQDLYDRAPCGYHSLDKYGTFIAINNTELDWLGYKRNEVIGQLKFSDLLTPESLITFRENFPKFWKQGWVNNLQFHMIRKDGTILPVLLNAIAFRDKAGNLSTRSTIFDITDRIQAESALRQSEERFRIALQNSPIVVFNQDTDLRYTWIYNPIYVYGLDVEAIVGKMDRELLNAEDAERMTGIKRRVLTSGEGRREETFMKVNGEIRYCDLTVEPLRNQTGEIVRITCACTDITDRKQAELALKQAKEELEMRVAERTLELSQTNDRLQSELKDRIAADAALRKSEARFRRLFESNVVGVIFADYSGRITEANDLFLQMVGYTREDLLLGKVRWDEMTPPEYSHIDRLAIEQAKITGVGTPWEKEFIRKDGSRVPILIGGALLDGYEDRVVAFVLDLSERQAALRDRKRAEEERAKLIAILEATSDFVSSASVDGQVFYFNSSARKILGIGKQQNLTNFNIPKGHPDWAFDLLQNEGIPAAMRDGIWVGETAILSYDGREIPVSQLIIAHKSADGNVKMISTIARDITQQKQVEATLRETERRSSTLLENVRLVVVGLDYKGKVDYVNPFFLNLTGYTQEEVLGKDWFENFLSQFQKQQVKKSFLEILEQDFHPHYQNYILTKSGEEMLIAWNNTVLKNLQGDAIGTLSIGEDITERHVIERMKDEFVSVVSHELRTPLTSIHGALNLLSTGLVDANSDKGKRVIEIAAYSAERLVRLVNDILELERLESGKISLSKQLCNATDMMMKATDIMLVMANRAGITLSVSPENIQLDADPDRIIQVLTNLLGNAIKFSSSGSTVSLTVELVNRENLTHILSPAALFAVKDRGRGIPGDKIESIFERFHQVDASDSRKKGGTGLGLTICRSIIQQHGGSIWVESSLGEGSSFYFTLPLALENKSYGD